MESLYSRMREMAQSLGFKMVGVTAATESAFYSEFLDWLKAGCGAEMRYLERNATARKSPESILPGVKSVLMLGLPYRVFWGSEIYPAGWGVVARYARSWDDYHHRIRNKLRMLCSEHRKYAPTAGVRGVVDTAPFPEREYALRAELGSLGRNRMFFHHKYGSAVFLAAILSTLDVHEMGGDRDVLSEDHGVTEKSVSGEAFSECGDCRACILACPTGALSDTGINAQRCLSYLTVEHRGAFPEELRTCIGNRLLGCDVCQEVCPRNRKAQKNIDMDLGCDESETESLNALELHELLQMDEDTFRQKYSRTALGRPGWEGIRRNAQAILALQEDGSKENRDKENHSSAGSAE